MRYWDHKSFLSIYQKVRDMNQYAAIGRKSERWKSDIHGMSGETGLRVYAGS